MAIKVSIVEDDSGIRESLCVLINGSTGYKCVSKFPNPVDAFDGISRDIPDVILMDINMPKMSGIECVKKIKRKFPAIQIIMLTVYEDTEKVFEALRAGATGYLLKRTQPAVLIDSIGMVHSGGSPMSPQIARKIVQSFHQEDKYSDAEFNLTQREEQILAGLARGFKYSEIADSLFISIDTVRSHIRKIYEKLHVRSRTEAVLKYLKK